MLAGSWGLARNVTVVGPLTIEKVSLGIAPICARVTARACPDADTPRPPIAPTLNAACNQERVVPRRLGHRRPVRQTVVRNLLHSVGLGDATEHVLAGFLSAAGHHSL